MLTYLEVDKEEVLAYLLAIDEIHAPACMCARMHVCMPCVLACMYVCHVCVHAPVDVCACDQHVPYARAAGRAADEGLMHACMHAYAYAYARAAGRAADDGFIDVACRAEHVVRVRVRDEGQGAGEG